MSDNPLYMMNDLTEDEVELIRRDRENQRGVRLSNRRRRPAKPQPPPVAKAALGDRLILPFVFLLGLVLLIALAPSALESLRGFATGHAAGPVAGPTTPPDAGPRYPTPVPYIPRDDRSAPPQPTAPVAYSLHIPAGSVTAWSPNGEPVDVVGQAYRVLETAGDWQHIELDGGGQLWLNTNPQPTAAAAPAVDQPQPTAVPPPGPVESWGPGGTSGGTTWGEPTALPLQNAIIPDMPQIEVPTPTWGSGGSSGGATW